MLRYMLDTDMCIYVGNAHSAKIAERFNRVAEQIAISTITFAELRYGAENSAKRTDNLKALDRFVGRLDVLPFSALAARHYGELRTELQRGGKPIGPYDMLIGAHARSEGLTLVTNNTKEFRRVRGLRVENWI